MEKIVTYGDMIGDINLASVNEVLALMGDEACGRASR